MARRKGRVKDKWREKRWVKVMAPESFNGAEIAYVPVTTDEGARGRVIEVTLYDILKGDPSQHNYKIYFQIDAVGEEEAGTIFKRFEYSKEFLRSLVRRGSSKVNFVMDTRTSDGHVFRIKIIALTQRQLNTSRQHALRLLAREVIDRTVPSMTVEQFVQASCYNRISTELSAAFKSVIKVRHVGLEKVKLIRTAEKETVLLKA